MTHPAILTTARSGLIAAAVALATLGAAPASAHDRAHDRVHDRLHDRDDNPPGPIGGPGTNWENPAGPRGGPGMGPDRGDWRRAITLQRRFFAAKCHLPSRGRSYRAERKRRYCRQLLRRHVAGHRHHRFDGGYRHFRHLGAPFGGVYRAIPRHGRAVIVTHRRGRDDDDRRTRGRHD